MPIKNEIIKQSVGICKKLLGSLFFIGKIVWSSKNYLINSSSSWLTFLDIILMWQFINLGRVGSYTVGIRCSISKGLQINLYTLTLSLEYQMQRKAGALIEIFCCYVRYSLVLGPSPLSILLTVTFLQNLKSFQNGNKLRVAGYV